MGAYRFALGTLLIALTLVFAGPARVMAQKGSDSKSEFKGSPEKILQLANDLYRAQRFAKAKEAYVVDLKKGPSNYDAQQDGENAGDRKGGQV